MPVLFLVTCVTAGMDKSAYYKTYSSMVALSEFVSSISSLQGGDLKYGFHPGAQHEVPRFTLATSGELPPKLDRLESLHAEETMWNMVIPNGLILYGHRGERYSLSHIDETGNIQPVTVDEDVIIVYDHNRGCEKRVTKAELAHYPAVMTVQVAPWAEDSVMVMYNSTDDPPASFVDVSPPVLEATLEDMVTVGKDMQGHGLVVHFGGCLSAGSIMPDEPGLQSVMKPHVVMYGVHPEESLTREESIAVREGQEWDARVSCEAVGIPAAKAFAEKLAYAGWSADVKADPMGLHAAISYVDMGDMTRKNDQGTMPFIEQVMIGLAHIMHWRVKDVHERMYKSDLDKDVIGAIKEAIRQGGKFDLEAYRRLFTLTDPQETDPEWLSRLRAFEEAHLTRHAPGYSFDMMWDSEKREVYITATAGLLIGPNGPRESYGEAITRPLTKVSLEQEKRMRQQYASYTQIVFSHPPQAA